MYVNQKLSCKLGSNKGFLNFEFEFEFGKMVFLLRGGSASFTPKRRVNCSNISGVTYRYCVVILSSNPVP